MIDLDRIDAACSTCYDDSLQCCKDTLALVAELREARELRGLG